MTIGPIQQAVDEILSRVYYAELQHKNIDNAAIEETETKFNVLGLVDRLHSEKLAEISNNFSFIKITDWGRQVQEQGGYIALLKSKEVKVNSDKPLKFKDKKYNLLRALYEKKFSRSQDVQNLLKPITVTWQEAYSLAESLKNEGLAKMEAVRDAVYAEISPAGIEFIEDGRFENHEYQPKDMFTAEEKEVFTIKIDELVYRLNKLEFGQEIIYDDLKEELETLKQLLEVLGKKDWKQNLEGKLVDLGFGKILDSAWDLIVNSFKDDKFLNS